MAKKKKETCPYCGKSFAYLSRHKCKIKEHVEGPLEEKSEIERRIERIEEKKREFNRTLRKDERFVLNIINREKDILFDRLMELSNKKRSDLEETLETLVLQSKIKMKRELIEASWTKHVYALEEIEVKVKDIRINKERKDFIWNMFSKQPCFICPFRDKCNETNLDQFNPQHCPWLTEWIEIAIKGEDYIINFDEIEARLQNV